MVVNETIRLRAALVEGTVILFGILLAFGIQAAWETRQEGARVDAFLTSLLLELEENQARLERRVEFLTGEITETETYLVDIVAAPVGPVSQDSIRGMIGAMGPLRIDPTSRAAFDDLANGGLQSIDDGELRREILLYGQLLEFYAQRQRAAEDWFVTRAQLYDEMEGDLVGALSPRGWIGRTDLEFAVSPDAFVLNRRYGNLLAARSNHLRVTRTSASNLISHIGDLRDRLNQRE